MSDLLHFRKKEHVKILIQRIRDIYPGGRLTIMEVCGTHTMAIARYALRGLMPEGLSLISGPGCPVCITPTSIIDAAIEVSKMPDMVVATFGDMMRVPGREKTLEMRKAEGGDIRVVYSVHDLLHMAEEQKDSMFTFISVGFETTTPGIALSILEAEQRGFDNVYFLVANRLVVPAMDTLCSSGDTQIDGFLCPGHVSVIIGYGAYRSIAEKYHIPCVVAGFEPVDILMAIHDIVDRLSKKSAGVGNAYSRVVTEQGNRRAVEVMSRVFRPVSAEWRGIGDIPQSGLALRGEFSHMDALKKFQIDLRQSPEPKGCRCGGVLKGSIIPPQCALFGERCTPETPVGPCMVSSEGSCAAYYRYGWEDG